MSLVSTASVWTNDDNSTKKRTPSMARKTIKKPVQMQEYQDYQETQESQEYVLTNIDDVQKMNDDRNNKVNDIINQMSAVSSENDGSKLADFNPPAKPSIQIKKDLQTGWVKGDDKIPNLDNPLQLPAPSFSNQSVNPYLNSANVLGNYNQVYDPANVGYKPYYANMGIGATGQTSDKMTEKLNYMIHLLENQQNEKTANVTEEFILYTFLGVFVIFVLDSFTRTGKYIR